MPVYCHALFCRTVNRIKINASIVQLLYICSISDIVDANVIAVKITQLIHGNNQVFIIRGHSCENVLLKPDHQIF